MSRRILFTLGIFLIFAAVFNIFQNPLINGYYRIKRIIPTVFQEMIGTNENSLLQNNDQMEIAEVSKEQNNDISFNQIEDINADQEEGFLPVSVDVSNIKTPTPQVTKEINTVPIRLSIPTINLEADIVNAQKKEIIQGGNTYVEWAAPDEYAIGWHFDSAFLGVPGNTVLNGHHNIFGKVFENLYKLIPGDEIFVYGNDLYKYKYIVTNTMILPERDVPFEQRLENAKWILPSDDERLTLITCWPYFSNTHRLIIVAKPMGAEPIPLPNERN